MRSQKATRRQRATHAEHRLTQIGACTRSPNAKTRVSPFSSRASLSGCKRPHHLKCQETKLQARKGLQNVRQKGPPTRPAVDPAVRRRRWKMAAVSMAVSLEYLPGRGATAELAPRTLLGCPLSHCLGRWLSALTRGEHSSIFARTLFDRPLMFAPRRSNGATAPLPDLTIRGRSLQERFRWQFDCHALSPAVHHGLRAGQLGAGWCSAYRCTDP